MNRLAVALLLVPAVASAAPPSAQAVFDRLKTLAGEWRSTDAANATRVTYRVIANGSALVESWRMSPTRESMTVYTMDGERLLATHYCPQGNAPRMQLIGTDDTGASRFFFIDGANLQDPAGAHEHAFWVRIEPSGELTRSETYIGNADQWGDHQEEGAAESFRRE